MAENAADVQLPLTVDVPSAEAAMLARILGIDPGDAPAKAAADQLVAVAKAAFAEYMLYFTGERVPNGVRELRELRLSLLAAYMPQGLPADRQVAQLFHLTLAQARNLIAGARARYPFELERTMRQAAARALREATRGDNENIVRITASDSLAAYLSEIVSSSSQAQALTRRQDASNRYDVTRRAVEVLCEQLGLQLSEVTALPPK